MTEAVEAFITRWRGSGGSERGNYQLFLDELADLLGVDRPQPHASDARDDAYVFERRVTFRHGDGSESHGFIDLYRRGSFVCEAKKLRQGVDTRGFDAAMLRARSEAEAYARFTARGPWKKRLPQLLDMLVALGRARATDGGYAA